METAVRERGWMGVTVRLRQGQTEIIEKETEIQWEASESASERVGEIEDKGERQRDTERREERRNEEKKNWVNI